MLVLRTIRSDDRNATVEMSRVETELDHWTVTNAQHIFCRSCRPRSTVGKAVPGRAIRPQPSVSEGFCLPRCREDAGGSRMGRGTGRKNYGSMRMFAYRDVTPREVLNRRNLLHCSDLERDFLPRNTGLRKIDRVSKMDRIP
jgi:hypothetical protein